MGGLLALVLLGLALALFLLHLAPPADSGEPPTRSLSAKDRGDRTASAGVAREPICGHPIATRRKAYWLGDEVHRARVAPAS